MSMSLLGVQHPLDLSQPRSLTKLSLEMVRARMSFIPTATTEPRIVVRLLRSLCFSPFLWNTGFVQMPDADLDTLRAPVTAALGINCTWESPPVLFDEVCDWYSS